MTFYPVTSVQTPYLTAYDKQTQRLHTKVQANIERLIFTTGNTFFFLTAPDKDSICLGSNFCHFCRMLGFFPFEANTALDCAFSLAAKHTNHGKAQREIWCPRGLQDK